MANIENMSLAEVARLLRRELRRHFPNHRLSVYCKHPASAAGITIVWRDGPTVGQVETMLAGYAIDNPAGGPTLLTVPGRELPALVRFDCGPVDLVRNVTDQRVAECITSIAHDNPGLLSAELAETLVSLAGDPQAVLEAAEGVDVPHTSMLVAGEHRLTGADLRDMGRGLPWLGRVLAHRTAYRPE